ncbi:MAG: group II intron maturase-specific domain-containing protein [Thermacetogeniaceae bacterium]
MGKAGVEVNTHGKVGAMDGIFTERFEHSLKYKEVACQLRTIYLTRQSQGKDKLREAPGCSNGMSAESRKAKPNFIMRGWVNYFKLADMKNLMETLDKWLRRRLRMVTWKRCKRVRTRRANLKKAGIPDGQAWQRVNARLGYWRVAGSWILTRVLPNEAFKKAGYLSLKELYLAA